MPQGANAPDEEHSPVSEPIQEPPTPAAQPDSQVKAAAPPVSYWAECLSKMDLNFFLSILSVSCWALAGNATRIALHGGFQRIPFLNTYEFFGPNCIGSFAMGLFMFALPAESELPVIHRALCVGFCGSFTTLSSWVVDVVNKSSAAGAFAELISGITMPFVFFLWGKDMAIGFWWLYRVLCTDAVAEASSGGERIEESAAAAQERRERNARYARIGEFVFLAMSIALAISIPIGIKVRINQGHIHTVSAADIKAVAMGPPGALVRFFLSVFLNKRPQWRSFPVGTLAANFFGCFLVVFMDNYAHHRPHNQWFWIVSNGVCGALSTVSSFVNEVVGFFTGNRVLMAYIYALVTLALTMTTGAVGRRSNYD